MKHSGLDRADGFVDLARLPGFQVVRCGRMPLSVADVLALLVLLSVLVVCGITAWVTVPAWELVPADWRDMWETWMGWWS